MPSITPNLRLSITNRETNKPFLNWRLGIDGPDDSNMIKLDKAWGDMKTMVDGAMAAVGHAYKAETVAGMTDHDKSYVYVGSETGYTNGNWYYWDEDQSAWVSGGVYNATALQTDDTLKLEGEAADAKATGEMIVINGTSSNGTRINITTTNEDVVIPTMDDVDDLKTQLNEIASFPTIDVDETVEYNCPVSAITDRLISTWELEDIRPGVRLYWNVDDVSASVHSADFTSLKIRAVQFDINGTVLSRTSYPSTLTINANATRVEFGILYSKTATTGESGSTFAETFAVKFQASYDGNFDVTIKALDSVLTEQGDTWEV